MASWKWLRKRAWSRYGSVAGSVNQWHGSADPDPDLHQNLGIRNTDCNFQSDNKSWNFIHWMFMKQCFDPSAMNLNPDSGFFAGLWNNWQNTQHATVLYLLIYFSYAVRYRQDFFCISLPVFVCLRICSRIINRDIITRKKILKASVQVPVTVLFWGEGVRGFHNPLKKPHYA